ncbi:MAG: FAD-dependent oxidoreductase [Actinomycetota bacterium]
MSTRLSMPDPGAARSFWLQEALGADPGEPCPPLEAHVAADVCIVGGGFAGLWTAIELSAREPAMRIALLEQDICGGGASGRNGGFFSSSWWDVEALCGLFGDDDGLRYAHAVSDTVGEAGTWLADHDVDAWFHHDGVLGIRTGTWQEGPGGEGPAAFLEARGLGDRMRPLTVERAREIADSPRITGARFIEDSAIVQPARLARGLRRVALERGVRIFERTTVTGLDRSRPAVVRTEHGAVKADQVVLAIGAWAAGWPGFRRSFGVIADHMVVTEPIPERLAEIGWTSFAGIADGRDLLFYLRPTDDHRIAIGGGGLAVVFGGRASGRSATHDRRVADVAARGLLWLFPQLEGVRFTHAWGGPIDQTPSFLPFYRTLQPGNVHAGLGFSGHGLSQTMVGSRILASMVLGVQDRWTSLPVVGGELGKAPPEPFRYPAIKAAGWALERGDRRADAGRPRGWLDATVGAAPQAWRDRLVARASRRRAG